MIEEDVYRPHSLEEVGTLVAPEVVARLNPSLSYGLWWFNRKRTVRRQVAEYGPEGRIYRNKVKTMQKPMSEWIAVPVPNSGVPREVVDRARSNKGPPSLIKFQVEVLGVVRGPHAVWRLRSTHD